eukprot:COSAG04_NODE_1363_length_7079_cov_19.484815_9_plen_127_part_00
MVLDVGPAMATFFVDGKLCDGGVAQRTDKAWAAGWCARLLLPSFEPWHLAYRKSSLTYRLWFVGLAGRTLLPRGIGLVTSGEAVKLGGAVRGGRLHGHALLVSELVGNWRHGNAQRARAVAGGVVQ